MSVQRTRRRSGRWRAVAAMPAVAAMVLSSSVPVRAAEPVARTSSADAMVVIEKADVPKKTKKKKKKKKQTHGSVEEMIEEVFGPRAGDALRIAHCESKFRPDAVSPAGAVGVFQIRERLHAWRVKEVKAGKSLRDARTNIRVAHALMKDQGWTPWVCARILGIVRTRTDRHGSHEQPSARGGGAPRVPRSPRMAP